MNPATHTPKARDPWWDGIDAEPLSEPAPLAPVPEGEPSRRSRRADRRRRRGGSRLPLPLRMLAGAARAVVRRVGRSRRVRTALRRLVIAGSAIAVISMAVGVVMLNNVVIRRSAELGALDDRRRELRTENAVMAAESARLSSVNRIAALAERQGMVRTIERPAFIYLEPGSSRITANVQRARELAARRALVAHRRAAAARAAAPAAAAAATRPAGDGGSVATPGDGGGAG